MMAKPMKSLELHYPMIQFLITFNSLLTCMDLLYGGQLESYGGQLESFCYFDHHTHFLARIVIILSCNHEL